MTDDVLLPQNATVTSKLQVTIPIRFARKYELTPRLHGSADSQRHGHAHYVLPPRHAPQGDRHRGQETAAARTKERS